MKSGVCKRVSSTYYTSGTCHVPLLRTQVIWPQNSVVLWYGSVLVVRLDYRHNGFYKTVKILTRSFRNFNTKILGTNWRSGLWRQLDSKGRGTNYGLFSYINNICLIIKVYFPYYFDEFIAHLTKKKDPCELLQSLGICLKLFQESHLGPLRQPKQKDSRWSHTASNIKSQYMCWLSVRSSLG